MLERGPVLTAKRESDPEKLQGPGGEADRGSGVLVSPMQPAKGTFLWVLVPAKSTLQTLICSIHFQKYCDTQPQHGLLHSDPSFSAGYLPHPGCPYPCFP